MAMYEYTVSYRSTSAHGNADAISRLPLPDFPQSTPLPSEMILLMEELDAFPVTVDRIRMCTNSDPLLSHVCQFVPSGWPDSVEDTELKPFMTGKMSSLCKMVASLVGVMWSFLKLAEQKC